MCVTVIYDGRPIETMSEARRLLGDAHVTTKDGYTLDAYGGASCLCPLNLEETAKRLGRTVKQPAKEDGDPMEIAFIRPSPSGD